MADAPGNPRAPLNPVYPERVCWGCDRYCPADDLACGNGTIRSPHPVELFGKDWLDWSRKHGTHNRTDNAHTALQTAPDDETGHGVIDSRDMAAL